MPASPACTSSTEQWVKGAGQDEALRRAGAIARRDRAGEVWDKPIAGNVIPLAGSVKEAGYTSEEWKLVYESRKILHDADLRVTATCVRVPVYVGHSMSANVEFDGADERGPKRPSCSRARRASRSSTAATATPTRSRAPASTRCSSAGCAKTRRRPNTLDLWVTGDNLRKGAALNAIQLAELLV